MKICVYCASSPKIDQKYFDATERLARLFVQNDVSLIYGGGAIGLMGKLADTVLEEGGSIKGIMPEFMNELEWGHKGVSDFEFTQTMAERKAKFLVGIDALVTLPGGTGTLEEVLEAITLKRLGRITVPIVILNTDGYYDPLKEMLNRTIEQGFMRDIHGKMWTFVDQPEEVIPAIRNSEAWSAEAIGFAANN